MTIQDRELATTGEDANGDVTFIMSTALMCSVEEVGKLTGTMGTVVIGDIGACFPLRRPHPPSRN